MRAKTPTVSTRTGRKPPRRSEAEEESPADSGAEPVVPVPGESAELLNVPLSPSAP